MGRQAPHSLPGNFLTLLANGSELNNFRAFGIAAGVTSKAQSGRRATCDQIFFGALMAAGTGNFLRDVSFVRKLDGLLDP